MNGKNTIDRQINAAGKGEAVLLPFFLGKVVRLILKRLGEKIGLCEK